MKMNKKGFTLIEMLVVIAIIAVLVSIVIPTVTSATEKAAEAADASNVRAAIATVTTNALANGTADPVVVTITQTTAGYVSEITAIGGLSTTDFNKVADAVKGQTVTVSWTAATTSAPAGVTITVATPSAGSTTAPTT